MDDARSRFSVHAKLHRQNKVHHLKLATVIPRFQHYCAGRAAAASLVACQVAARGGTPVSGTSRRGAALSPPSAKLSAELPARRCRQERRVHAQSATRSRFRLAPRVDV